LTFGKIGYKIKLHWDIERIDGINHYLTTDTGFAALLAISGAKLAKLNATTFPAEFFFVQNSHIDFEDLKFQWESGIAEGNISAFFKAYRGFTREINRTNRSGLQ